MSASHKNLRTLSPVTWCALIAGLTTLLCCLPAWVAYLVIGCSVLGLVQLSEDTRRSKANRVRKAMAICGYSLTTAAKTANMDLGDFTRMLSGERSLDDWRLEMLGDEFMRTLALLELQERGLPEFAKTALKIEPALTLLTKVSA